MKFLKWLGYLFVIWLAVLGGTFLLRHLAVARAGQENYAADAAGVADNSCAPATSGGVICEMRLPPGVTAQNYDRAGTRSAALVDWCRLVRAGRQHGAVRTFVRTSDENVVDDFTISATSCP